MFKRINELIDIHDLKYEIKDINKDFKDEDNFFSTLNG